MSNDGDQKTERSWGRSQWYPHFENESLQDSHGSLGSAVEWNFHPDGPGSCECILHPWQVLSRPDLKQHCVTRWYPKIIRPPRMGDLEGTRSLGNAYISWLECQCHCWHFGNRSLMSFAADTSWSRHGKSQWIIHTFYSHWLREHYRRSGKTLKASGHPVFIPGIVSCDSCGWFWCRQLQSSRCHHQDAGIEGIGLAQRFQSLKYIYIDNCTVRKASGQKPSVDHFLLWFPCAALPFAKD